MSKTLVIDCTTSGSGETVGLPLGPASYVGGGALNLKIYWGETPGRYTLYKDGSYEIFQERKGEGDESIESDSMTTSGHWAPTHTYERDGTYTIKVYGGYGGKIAFSQTSEHDGQGVASINDLRHEDATPEAFTKIRYAKGLYIHGQGDFNGFTNLINDGKLKQLKIIKSADPANSIADSGSGTLFMDHTFKDCDNIKGSFSSVLGKKIGDAVRSAQGTFMGSSFNGNLSKWNLSKVTSLLNFCKDAANFQGRGIARLFKMPNLLEILEGAFQGCVALRGKGFNRWNVVNVVNIKNAFKGADVSKVNVKKWNVTNVIFSTGFGITGNKAPKTATANGTSLQTGTTSPDFVLPNSLTVTKYDSEWESDNGNGETPAGEYTKQSAIEFANESGDLWNNIFETVSAGELGGKTLAYYEQGEGSDDEWKHWIVIDSDQSKFALVQLASTNDFEDIDGVEAIDASISLLNWSGSDIEGEDNSQNERINVADAD